MITLAQFHASAKKALGRQADPQQREAINASGDEAIFLVAGPGSGKTTCLALRILKLVFVDGVAAGGILATTFTKKAAAELRSRILGWGFELADHIGKERKYTRGVRDAAQALDLNQIRTGTIDSICERLLSEYRPAETDVWIPVDEFAAATMMLRHGLFDDGRYRDKELDKLLLELSGRSSSFGWNIVAKSNLLRVLWDRRYHDQIDWQAFVKSAPKGRKRAYAKLRDALEAYGTALEDGHFVDFARLEDEVLRRLRAGLLDDFRNELKVVLVDEYQDTNLLQEQIYFELAKGCDGALTVVGDDDQSLYRFRGATVELFTRFASRYRSRFRRTIKPLFLSNNYRSTETIVDFVSQFVCGDPSFQRARVKNKPPLICRRTGTATPVLGMFRDSLAELANDLANFVGDVFSGDGVELPDGSTVRCDPVSGAAGDCALLTGSPREYSSGGNERLPRLLRLALYKDYGIDIFNPRGMPFFENESVERVLGLMLKALDPSGDVEREVKIGGGVRGTFRTWRESADSHLRAHKTNKDLKSYVKSWTRRDPDRSGYGWPRSVSALELLYALTHYFSVFYDDPEHQLYLEALCRQLNASAQIGWYDAQLIVDNSRPELESKSVAELIRNFFAPIATGTVQINEELVEAFPRDRVSVLSIHQSKGLEFPLTIVDIGSDFSRNHPAQRFRRYPDAPGLSHTLEDRLRPHSPLRVPKRDALDRAFDDLVRQYFVAFSRAQDVLLLVGLNRSSPAGGIPNVAAGWNRRQQLVYDEDDYMEL